jgi:hypothetical protein
MSDLKSSDASTPNPWSQLWGQTVLPSWNLLGSDPAAVELREHWFAQKSWISDSLQVVDIGSGPAVLARLFASMDSGHPRPAAATQWLCVDQAQIPSKSVSDLPFVTGKFGVPWENLSASEHHANAIVSNFGLEYVSHEHIARGCASWLEKGGRLHAVVHAQGSVIDRQSALGLSDLNLILDELGFPEQVSALLKSKLTAPSDSVARMMHGVEVRDAFNQSVNRMKTVLDERGDVQSALLDWLVISRDIVQGISKGTLGAAQEHLKTLRVLYEAERWRLTAMRSRALDQSGMDAIAHELKLSGFDPIKISLLECSLGTVAWTVDAHKMSRSF